MNNFNTQAAEASLIAIVNTAQQLVDRHGIDFSHAMLVIAEHRLTTADNTEESLPNPIDENCDLDITHGDTTTGRNPLKLQKIGSNNHSGCVGVAWNRQSENWVAYITVSRHRYHLISTKDWWKAVCARKAAEHEHGFHANHGEPAQ